MRPPQWSPEDCDWARAAYKVRVRTTMYLWGSAGISQNLNFAQPLVLHVYNDVHGEVVNIGTQVAGGAQTALGSLQPGEAVSIQMQGISGVYATCALESNVSCLIRESA
jgi:hypothetical protein